MSDIQTILQLLQRQPNLGPPAYSTVTASPDYHRPAVKVQPVGLTASHFFSHTGTQVRIFSALYSVGLSFFFSSCKMSQVIITLLGGVFVSTEVEHQLAVTVIHHSLCNLPNSHCFIKYSFCKLLHTVTSECLDGSVCFPLFLQ